MDPLLQKDLQKLYECPRINEFMTLLSQWVKKYSLKEIVETVALSSASRKTSIMGLETAWLLSQFFHSQNRLLPIAQMMWINLCEAARSSEIDNIKEQFGTPPRASELNMDVFKKAYRERDFQKTFRWFVFLAREEKHRKEMMSFLVSQVFSDEADAGYKIGYLIQTQKFCEFFQWKDFYVYWFSTLHDLLYTPSKVELFHEVEAYCKEVTPVLSNSGFFNEVIYSDIKDSVFNDEKSVTLEKISDALNTQKQSLSSLWELLKLISGETSLEAFHYTSYLFEAVPFLKLEDQFKALLQASLFIKKMAILAKPFKVIVEEPLGTVEEKKVPSFFLEYAIRRGQVGKALGALNTLVEHPEEMNQVTLELLAFLASQNSNILMAKKNISCATLSIKNYVQVSHPFRHLYLKVLVKFLAEQPKDNTIYHALSNTQKIKLGYYSLEGDFGF
ncbi:MAG: hypothetical protein A2Z91_09035 [Deltaproteobacteria bacterium GWA2_38_16]|nr:MAG: hypothetical protein A2Z91_09035 [Deltaproteobacteria bacterium GWA2_38_16]OGQ02558.1 MAG: hypothetical protein A3D19_09695 [Deltaproteobacteria bacterium RIFCSPHIGHO2_02_FULL_38_15]OGQ30593.1 MAG: hypothetical protein A3A72_08165 [Deltaproteobacteria bacterium RIFCSPLOWO2_01_FULL_38_9]HBQ20987.1 hypothetical protein [Deltaproteobacteria bacterium]